MTPMPDVPPVTTPHAGEIIAGNYPTTSESMTAQSALDLFQKSAISVGTSNTAETMFALIEANATGQTPDALLSKFTDDQRQAFDRALQQLNMGHGASVMAQDILNTKVQLNGTATEFEAAVQELIASYAASGGPESPKNQADFTRKYQELLQQAKDSADKLGQNHKSTQDQLAAGVQKGAIPEVPSTMAPTSPSNPSVPGMPDGALGPALQNVAGQMMKPPQMPMPNLGQVAQPAAQSAQSAIKELMSGKGQGVPISDDALKRLTTSAGLGQQGASLSNARGPGLPGGSESSDTGLGRPTGLGRNNGHEPGGRHAAAPGNATPESETGLDGKPHTPPTTAAATSAPAASTPATTLSSGDAATGPDTLTPSTQTHVSAGDSALAGPTLSAAQAPMAGPAAGPMMPMMPMAPLAGGSGGGAGSSGSGAARSTAAFRPDLGVPDAELKDFGTAFRGLEHATDQQHIAASLAVGLSRQHQRFGVSTLVAVGISQSQAVFVTSDGLGFLARGLMAQPNSTPLIKLVPDAFVYRWLGCAQPWRPLLEAAAVGLVAPFDAVVSTDPSAQGADVLVLSEREIAEVNSIPGAENRASIDAIDPEDIDVVLNHSLGVWGQPRESMGVLLRRAWSLRWSGESDPRMYAPTWAQYLLAAAITDLQVGDIDGARYLLRNVLRMPAPAQVRP